MPGVTDRAEAWLRGATPCPRLGAATKSANLTTQERPRGATLCPRSGDCASAVGPRGATPHSRSGGAAVRTYPSSKVRSSGCALLEKL